MIVSPAPRPTVLSSRQVFPRKSGPAIGQTRPGKTDAEHANLLLDVKQACRSYEILLALGWLSKANTAGEKRIGDAPLLAFAFWVGEDDALKHI